jgi:YVTN family beta-propeller protein
MKFKMLALIVVFAFISCNEQKVINDTKLQQKFLVAVDSINPKLVLYDINEGILSEDIYYEKNSKILPGKISKIAEYGNMLFLFMPDVYKIEIISKETFESLQTIDFSEEKLEPTDIGFVNMTDAYICHGNDSILTLLDIYPEHLVPARQIKVGASPLSVAWTDEQNHLVIANQDDNTVSIVDSREHSEIAKIKVPTAPTLAGIGSDINKAIIISLGDGKINSNQKTTAKASFIDIENKEVLSSIELEIPNIDAVTVFPLKMVITNLDWAYIQTTTHLLRLDVYRESKITTLMDNFNNDIIYFKLRNQILVVNDSLKQLTLYSADKFDKLYSFNINAKLITALPL